MADRSTVPTRKRRLHEPEDDSYVRSLTAGTRVAMVWELTRQAWAFTDAFRNEPRLRRDVVRVTRRGR